MSLKHMVVASLVGAFLALGGGSISAQNTMTGGTVSSGASQISGSGTSPSREAKPETIGEGKQRRISKADPRKGGKIGADGSLPKPKVKDDQFRCLAPSGVC